MNEFDKKKIMCNHSEICMGLSPKNENFILKILSYNKNAYVNCTWSLKSPFSKKKKKSSDNITAL